MKLTVAQLFTPEDGCAFIPLMWGGRKETPTEVLLRATATMSALTHAVPKELAVNPFWMRIADDGLGYSPAPSTVDGLQELVRKENEKPTGPTTLQLLLFADNTDAGLLASFNLNAGAEQTHVGNSCTVTLEQGYPLGPVDAAEDLFRELIRIWQPETAILCTDRTIADIGDLYDTYAGYLSWVSASATDVPTYLSSARAEHFGDGVLLSARHWTVDGVRRMHQELLAESVPALTAIAAVQVVPQFPPK